MAKGKEKERKKKVMEQVLEAPARWSQSEVQTGSKIQKVSAIEMLQLIGWQI